MGTRTSKHNHGRKALYKEHGAADARAMKHGTVAQTEEHSRITAVHRANTGLPSSEDVGSIPTSPPTKINKPPSALAAVYRRASAEGKQIRIPRNHFTRSIGRVANVLRLTPSQKEKKENEQAREDLYRLLKEKYEKSKTDFFWMLGKLDSTVEYAVPEMWHECDPFELLETFEKIDWHRMALALGYRELELKKYARA